MQESRLPKGWLRELGCSGFSLLITPLLLSSKLIFLLFSGSFNSFICISNLYHCLSHHCLSNHCLSNHCLSYHCLSNHCLSYNCSIPSLLPSFLSWLLPPGCLRQQQCCVSWHQQICPPCVKLWYVSVQARIELCLQFINGKQSIEPVEAERREPAARGFRKRTQLPIQKPLTLCYANSILQVLFHHPVFSRLVLKSE